MNKLFEEISSVERREIIRYYKKQMKRSYSVNICHVINNNINVKNTNYEKVAVTPVINNNTNKLAYKHDQKIKKMFSEYLIKNQKKKQKILMTNLLIIEEELIIVDIFVILLKILIMLIMIAKFLLKFVIAFIVIT